MKFLSILGREHELCRAELEAVYGPVEKLGNFGAVFNVDLENEKPNIDHLGGSIKLCQVEQSTLPAKASESEIASDISKLLIAHATTGKLNFAISLYGLYPGELRRLQRLGLSVKKQLVAQGIGTRYVAPKSGSALTAAQIKYNNLTSKGTEVVIVVLPSGISIARTFGVQDIDSYSKRDWDRPVRDSKVGMLPPKLAQIMINLAGVKQGTSIFDPFCGNGVIMQEALLAGHDTFGSDISPDMVEASQKNLDWLKDNYELATQYSVELADATRLGSLPENSVIVSEGYLGTPTTRPLSPSEISSRRQPVEDIYEKFLKNTAELMESGQQMVISFPAWQSFGGLIHLKVIDRIEQMGYTFKQCSGQNTLVYRRENQFVGREIAVLVRK